jgi:benzoyl-CoA reductase subunit D
VMDGVVLATGGLALDAGLIAAIGEQANKIKNFTASVKSHPDSPYAGAIGAALWGAFRHEKLAQLGQLRQAS